MLMVDIKNRFVLVSYHKDHLAHFARKLKETAESDVAMFSKLIVARCEVMKTRLVLIQLIHAGYIFFLP